MPKTVVKKKPAPSGVLKPAKPPVARKVVPTSVYLHDATRLKLEAMVDETGRTKSQIISGLIEGADGEMLTRLARISDELSQLIA